MKLSQLVSYLIQLESYNISNASLKIHQHLDPMINFITNHDFQVSQCSYGLKFTVEKIDHEIDNLHRHVAELKQAIINQIKTLEPDYFVDSYRLYQDSFLCKETDHNLIDRRLRLPLEIKQRLRARLLLHSQWQYPGLILRPGHEPWIKDMVALDPLYLVDTHIDRLWPALSHFESAYQQRVRRIVLQENMESLMLHSIPQNQLGFVLVYHYFNFRPLEVIRKLLSELFSCLRPGGILACTFNDCDRPGGVELVEHRYACYTPLRLILSAAEIIGFELAEHLVVDEAVTWIELRKPGKLTSYRGGQCLARIVANSNRP